MFPESAGGVTNPCIMTVAHCFYIRVTSLALWLLISSCLQGTAQIPGRPPPAFFTLAGRITDSVGAGLSHATVQYIPVVGTVDAFAAADTLSTLTADDGSFGFTRLVNRRFRLVVTMKGYQASGGSFLIQDGEKAVRMSSIVLHADYLVLDPVVIRAFRPVIITQDTITYNIAAFAIREGSVVQEILARLPGVEVDMDGNVIVQGKKITRVLVNGKEYFGGDVLLAIQNLPADIVDKIQVIDDYGDKARLTGIHSGTISKVLNITLKSNLHRGFFGNADAAGGTGGKYAGSVFGNAFDGDRQLSGQVRVSNNSPIGNDPSQSFNASYANQWTPAWGATLSGGVSHEAPETTDSTRQYSYYPLDTLEQGQSQRTKSRSTTAQLESVVTWKPDPFSLLRLDASGNFLQGHSVAMSQLQTFEQDSGYAKSTVGSSSSQVQSYSRSGNGNFHYEKTAPHSRRRLSLDAGLGYSSGNMVTNLQSTTAVLSGGVMAPGISGGLATPTYLQYLTNNNNTSTNLHVSGSYFFPLGQTSFFETGYHLSSSRSRSDLVTQTPGNAGGPFEIIDSLSQQLLVRSLSQILHAGYDTKWKKLDLDAGVDVQTGVQDGRVAGVKTSSHYGYTFLLPNIQAAWRFNQGQRLQLNITSNTFLPSVQQLLPVPNVSNPQYPITGNPNLKASTTTNAGLVYEHSVLRATQYFGFGVGLAYNQTWQAIVQNLSFPKDSSAVIASTTYVNVGSIGNENASYHLDFPSFFHKRIRVFYNGNIRRSQTVTVTDSIQQATLTWTWDQSAHIQWLIPNLVEMDLGGTYSRLHSHYVATGGAGNAFQSATLVLEAKYYVLKSWTIGYRVSEPYIQTGSGLSPTPLLLNVYVQRQFLRDHRLSVTLSGFNLLNQTATTGQSMTPTSLVEARPELTGRYMLIMLKWNLQRLK